jgi:hypothetical protein
MEALALANQTRSYRAALKREIDRNWRVAVRSLTGDDPLLESMKVYDLLAAIRGVGPTKVQRLLLLARCSVSKTVGGLSNRQRAELLLVLARSQAERRYR